MLWVRLIVGAAATCLAMSPAPAQETAEETPREATPSAPILRIDTEQHLAVIHAMAVSPDGTMIATAGDDKTLRIWSASDGELLTVMRPQIGPGPDGLLYAAAWHWDGRRLLAGGVSYDEEGANGLYVMRPGRGEIEHRLPLSGVIRQIATAETGDGRRLWAASLSGGGRGRIDVREQGRRGRLYTYALEAPPSWAEIADDGALFVAVENGELHERALDGTVRVHQLGQGAQPAIARLSPDGTLIAVGYWNRRQVDVLRRSDFRNVAVLTGPLGAPTGDAVQHFNAIAWRPREGAPGGGELWAAGSYGDLLTGRAIVRRWADVTKNEDFADVAVADDGVVKLVPLPDGGMAFAASDPAWGVLEPDMSTRYVRARPGGDFRSAWRNLFAIDTASARIALRYDLAGVVGDVVFRLDDLQLDAADAHDDLREDGRLAAGWRTPEAPMALEGWDDGRVPSWKGAPVPLLDNEFARAAESVPDAPALADARDGFVLAADRGLYLHDAEGRRVAEAATASAVFAVLGLEDGRFLTAEGDGALRWYRRDGAHLIETAALFIERAVEGPPTRWLAWIEDGRFAHSADGGERLAGYHVNRGSKQAARWIDFSQIYADRYDPAAVRATLRRGGPPVLEAAASEDAADFVVAATPDVRITEVCPFVGGVGQPCFPADVVTRGLGPAEAGADAVDAYVGGVRELGPEVDRVRLLYEVRGLEGLPDRIDVFLNEATTGADLIKRGLGAANLGVEDQVLRGGRDVHLVDGLNRVSLRVYDASGAFGVSQRLSLRRAERVSVTPPSLHVLAIGADAYGGDLAPLTFAEADAETVLRVIEANRSTSYAEIAGRFLSNPTRDEILAALGEMAEVIGPDDGFVLYMAGHGVQTAEGRYVFVPPDVTSAARLGEDGLDQDRLLSAVGAIRAGNKLLLLDTCHAGAFEAPERAAGAMNNESGFMVIAAAAPEAEALDGYDDENGVFAYALREGLTGGAAFLSSEVDAEALGLFLSRRVPQLAAEKRFRQTPVVRNAKSDGMFPITEVAR